jgi:hypothetical protein
VLGAVGRGAVVRHLLDQVLDDLTHVTDDRHVGDAVLRDLGRVDVGVDHLGVRGERRQLTGDAVVEASPEGDDQVRLLQARDGGDRAVHAGHAEVERLAVGHRATCHEGRDDGDLGQLDEPAQLLARSGPHDAPTDVQDRSLRRCHEARGLANLLAVRAKHRSVAGQVDLRRPGERRLRLEGVLADVDQDRARASGARDVEGLGDGLRDLRRVGHEVVVLRDRHGDATDVGLLEGVGADGGAGHLARDRHHGHRVHVRVGDRRHQVGRARTRGRHADPDLARGRRVALGRVTGALLVAHEDVADLLGVEHRVVGRQDRAARDAEDGVAADGLEGEYERLRPGDLAGRCDGLGGLRLRRGSGTGQGGHVSGRWRLLRRVAHDHFLVSSTSLSCRVWLTPPTKKPFGPMAGRKGAR